MKAILRRNGRTQDPEGTVLRFGRMEIDERARELRIDGIDAKLKPREFALLLELARNPGVAFTRERLLQKVWGFDFGGDERTVDVHVHRLRNKLQSHFALPQVVRTVHGTGYKFARP